VRDIGCGHVIAGHPFYLTMPKVWGVKLTGKLPDWVSAKDIILEMLRRHTVKGGLGHIIEYYGPGLKELSAMDRHVIANMGTELGATTTVFPADDEVRAFLREHERGEDWTELIVDPEATYERHDEIDLAALEPLIELSSPMQLSPFASWLGCRSIVISVHLLTGYRDLQLLAGVKERN
jgi:aconitate hydratase